MNNTINYSIIIPHKNIPFLLQRCLDSIPRRMDIQIIIVDDNSNQDQVDFSHFPGFGESCVEVYFTKEGRGAGYARNIGMKHAKGKWLLFMDADDYLLEDAFIYFDKYIHSDNDIIFFKPTSVYSDTGDLADRHHVYCMMIEEALFCNTEYPLRISHCVPWCKMIHHRLVTDNQITFEEVPASNDVMFALNIGLKADKIAVENNTVYCVTVARGSITNTVNIRNIESVFNVKIRKNIMLKRYGYKPVCSVMYQIYMASKFGIIPCVKLFFKALFTGNLFVGWNNWYSTFKHGVKRYLKYEVKG